MHPAFSVIFFTTTSGAGYGLLALLGLFSALNWIPLENSFNLVAITFALLLVTSGLLASTAHLGHPKRAWRALSQWRSSWLSREGIFAILTYVPASMFWLCGGFPNTFAIGWGLWGIMTAILSLITIYCTAQIYASLKTIRQWNTYHVPLVYLLIGLLDGALIITFLATVFEIFIVQFSWIIILLSFLAGTTKLAYWSAIDTETTRSTSATATGLGDGTEPVSMLDAPTTSDNFVMREMGFRIARKHAQRLRKITFLTLFAIPVTIALITLLESSQIMMLTLSALAVISATVGTIIERWIFFAEAKHVVTLFYGAKTA